jgi:formylglycine-generating enzyme required for sulfatase activity
MTPGGATTDSPGSTGDLVAVPAGTFLMGCADFYPEERPVHRVAVDAFWMDRHPVTVAEFRRFVRATGYLTVAERPLDPAQYPEADPSLLVPGSLVFRGTRGPVDLRDVSAWWAYVPGARWNRPEGPHSDTYSRARHPVVHVAHEDAEAYAACAGKALPTEAEWERAARGGLEAATYAWGDDDDPALANRWIGDFPWRGHRGTSPVGSFPPNGFGACDMTGNVWEWTADFFAPRHPDEVAKACCVPRNPRVTSPGASLTPGQPGADIPRRVIKGGSHLCAPSYCLRYRPAARQGEAVDTSTSHIGFRCVVRAA